MNTVELFNVSTPFQGTLALAGRSSSLHNFPKIHKASLRKVGWWKDHLSWYFMEKKVDDLCHVLYPSFQSKPSPPCWLTADSWMERVRRLGSFHIPSSAPMQKGDVSPTGRGNEGMWRYRIPIPPKKHFQKKIWNPPKDSKKWRVFSEMTFASSKSGHGCKRSFYQA